MSPSYYVGLTLHLVLFLALVGTCAFNDDELAHDWSDCLIPLGLLLMPMILALLGGARRSKALLTAATCASILLGLLFLLGPGLFLLLPGILYGLAAASLDGQQELRRTR